jgi:hypothetical protein
MSLTDTTRSITTGSFALSNAIAKTSRSLNAFVRDVREARSELDALSAELHSLDGVLDLLKDDAASFPAHLAARTPTVLQHCTAVVNELEGYVSILNSNELSKQAKKLRWAATKSHMAKLRLTLDGYKSTLGLALDLVAFTSAAGQDFRPESPSEALDVKKNISKTVAEMGRLSTKLQGDFQKNAALRSYLDALQLYADATGINFEPDHASSSSTIDAPDSAIEMSDDPPFKNSRDPSLPVQEEIDELLDELKEMPSNRPPTPPPRDMRRSLSIRSVGSPSELNRPGTGESEYTFVTKIDSVVETALSPPPPAKRSLMGRMFGSTSSRKQSTSSSSAASIRTIPSRPSTPVSSAATETPPTLPRRGSRRMSTLKSFSIFRPVSEAAAEPEPAEPNAIFGVSLQKSIQVARGSAKTRHAAGKGGSSGGTSHRDFPLCVYKCVQFISQGTTEAGGVAAPDIFGEAGDPRRLAALKDLFSSPPTYGEDVNWEWFTAYEAADLILLYLSELPKPVVPESVARRWISLSRQATVTGGSRLDQCIDFWEEALSGVRGPARNLLKLLLNLWGDVAEAADRNDMTAERLAGMVLQPLMHSPTRTYTTDYMLGLAFLIRKRSEYLALMQGNKGKAKAAF